MLNYKEQELALEETARKRARDNRIIQLQTCYRHYGDMMARITDKPIDPSGDAVIVRSDIVMFIVDRMALCRTTIETLMKQ